MSRQRPFPNELIHETTSLLDPTGVISHSILTTDLIKNYSENKGVVYKNESSIFDFENLAENLQKQSKKIHDAFYEPPTIENSYLKTINQSDDDNNFENVSQKFRDCLDKYRVAFADKFALPSLTIGINTYDTAYLKLQNSINYVNMSNLNHVRVMIDMLESMKNKTLEVLKNPAAAATATSSSSASVPATAAASSSSSSTTATAATTAAPASTPAAATAAAPSSTTTATSPASLSNLNYDANLTTIDKNNLKNLKNWSAKEIDILEESQNHETVLYVIGQVFNIIPPDYYESFLKEKPSSASSLSSISKTKFFEFIKKDPASNIMSISKDGTLYVGVIINGQKNGKGMMRWANGSIFEGEFANDFITNGTFRKNDGTSNNLINNATTSVATFYGSDGTFNMDTGDFTPTSVGAVVAVSSP